MGATAFQKIGPELGVEVMIRQPEMKAESPSPNPLVGAVPFRTTGLKLSRSQEYWLTIGESMGTWLIRIKTKKST